MQYYNVKLRLAGSTMNEVRRTVSAPEGLIMMFIHGEDALTDVKPTENKEVNLVEEKNRLRSRYDSALAKSDQSVDTIFGPLGQVPQELPAEFMARFVQTDDVVPLRAPAPEASVVEESDDEVSLANIME